MYGKIWLLISKVDLVRKSVDTFVANKKLDLLTSFFVVTAVFCLLACSEKKTAIVEQSKFSKVEKEHIENIKIPECARHHDFSDENLYMVFFAKNSDVLDQKAKSTVSDFFNLWRKRNGVLAVLEANQDISENAKYNEDLSSKRGKAVLRYLSVLGVPEWRMHVADNKYGKPLVKNVSNDFESQNAFVYIKPYFLPSEQQKTYLSECYTWITNNCFMSGFLDTETVNSCKYVFHSVYK